MAINSTSTVSILGLQLGRNNERISEISSKLQDAIKSTSSGASNKYDSRAKLEASGLGDIYDRTQKALLTAQNNNINVDTTFAKLNNDQRFLTDLNAVVVGFKSSFFESDTMGTKAEKVDRALEKIEHILTMTDAAGRYILGGNDPYTHPLTRFDAQGNSVQIKLTEQSNLVGKLVTTNYASDSGANDNLVTLSSSHKTKESFLYPSMQAVANTIGYINMYKAPEDTFTAQEFDTAYQQQIKSRGEVDILVKLELEKIEQARQVNTLDIQTATDTNTALFEGDLVESAGLVQNLMHSMLANVTLNQLSDKAFNTLLERTRV